MEFIHKFSDNGIHVLFHEFLTDLVYHGIRWHRKRSFGRRFLRFLRSLLLIFIFVVIFVVSTTFFSIPTEAAATVLRTRRTFGGGTFTVLT